MNIKLLPPSPSYAEFFHRWRGESNTIKFNPVKAMSLDEARELLENAPKSLCPLAEASTHRWFISLQNEIVGVVSLTEVSLNAGTGQIGYTIGETHQGRGIATAALKLWTDLLFEKTDLIKLTALVNEENTASLRVMEKCGYARESFLKDHFLIQNKPSNQILFGLLRPK
jgi:RimJ/RimL family protein N-acetyltransferase